VSHREIPEMCANHLFPKQMSGKKKKKGRTCNCHGSSLQFCRSISVLWHLRSLAGDARGEGGKKKGGGKRLNYIKPAALSLLPPGKEKKKGDTKCYEGKSNFKKAKIVRNCAALGRAKENSRGKKERKRKGELKLQASDTPNAIALQ